MRWGSRRFDRDRVSAPDVAKPSRYFNETLPGRVGRNPHDLSRAATEERLRRLLVADVRFVPHPSFDDPAAHPEILGPAPALSGGQSTPRVEHPAGRSLCPTGPSTDPLLARAQEAHLFRKMNFLKHQAVRLRDAITLAEAKPEDLDRIEALLGEALALRDRILRANFRLVYSMVKRVIRPGQDLAEMASDGFVALLRAVERFDFARGHKFSTYASWAILHTLPREPPRGRRRDRLVTGRDAVLASVPDHRDDTRPREVEQERLRKAVQGMLGRLNARERTIIVSRYGLEGAREKTLGQLGAELGITKERVRQIEVRARDKLRELAAGEKFELLAS
jgi:RNA polymerase primary sigma factor